MSSKCRKESVGLGIRGHERPGSIPTGENILSLDFISRSKASDANIGSEDAIDSNI